MVATASAATSRLSLRSQAWNFARHFLEMCIAMCVIGTPLVLLWNAAINAAGLDLAKVAPAAVFVTAIIYTAPMALWMRFRGMPSRLTAEMSAATIGLAILLIALTVVGVMSSSALAEYATPRFCGPACAVMLLAMLPRLDHYAGRAGHAMESHGT